jgi:hypothetical protein
MGSKFSLMGMAINVNPKMQYLHVYFKCTLFVSSLNSILVWRYKIPTIFGNFKCNTHIIMEDHTSYVGENVIHAWWFENHSVYGVQ